MSPRSHVPESDARSRLDVYVARAESLSRAQAGSLIDDGLVRVNDIVQRKAYHVVEGDVVDVGERIVEAPPPPEGVEVVYSDDALLVVSKPSGVVVHAAPGVHVGTLVDALVAQGHDLAQSAGVGRAGIVHRLDKDVSGLLIVAKTDDAHSKLAAAMKQRLIERRYVALVAGSPGSDRGKIDAPIGRDPRYRTRMAVVPDGRAAVTWFSVTKRFDSCAQLDVRLETGRTHQIRVHLASIGHPVVGDSAYARDPTFAKSLGLKRPFLHAYRLGFDHPDDGRRLEFELPLPVDLAAILEALR